MSRVTGNLVGRERELSELRHGLEGALNGRGGLFMVAGDPGVGKTALADEIGAEAVAAGALVLWGRAWDGGGAPAYWPWLRIMRRLAAERDLSAAIEALGPETCARLTQLLPDIVGGAPSPRRRRRHHRRSPTPRAFRSSTPSPRCCARPPTRGR